ncbi:MULTISPECIES: alpha/beta fold hydrolase [Nitrosomonas]|uniref:Hydrolase n=1 Tax=Nitrosomonas communis TaxID=44574 RepID=A0A0F7KD68_9PROT|nr:MULTISPECIES: alpha/beta hydrolase [Nitrosomonas]AKH37113.1 hydrolase [Nitrosomonas communis]TYP94568.1 pimeloyl-ACP methyl ester carboxylesterase [Nitrosomonas communis]UVS62281.1 alpha/beta hydrolase [Nitrosomonas sp. PLL12]
MELITSRDGTSIACWQSGAGDPLLFVHGTSGDHSVWTSVLPLLEPHYNVRTVDRRGRGASDDASEYALERENEDVAAVIDAIGAHTCLIGHSFGGLCALEAALLTPNIKGLVLYEPSISLAGSGWSAEIEASLKARLESGNLEEALLLFFNEIVKISPQELAIMQTGPHWVGRVAAAHTILRELQSVNRYTFEPQRFKSLQIPVLLLVGKNSAKRRHLTAEMLHQHLPVSQIKTLPGQQHGAMRTAPDLFVHEILEFIKAI